MTTTKQLADNLSEADWQNTLIDLLKTYGYLVHCERPALNQRGQWSVPIQGDAGFPDIVAVRVDPYKGWPCLLFIECKTSRGRLSEEQKCWRAGIEGKFTGAEYILARPQDYERLVEGLR